MNKEEKEMLSLLEERLKAMEENLIKERERILRVVKRIKDGYSFPVNLFSDPYLFWRWKMLAKKILKLKRKIDIYRRAKQGLRNNRSGLALEVLNEILEKVPPVIGPPFDGDSLGWPNPYFQELIGLRKSLTESGK